MSWSLFMFLFIAAIYYLFYLFGCLRIKQGVKKVKCSSEREVRRFRDWTNWDDVRDHITAVLSHMTSGGPDWPTMFSFFKTKCLHFAINGRDIFILYFKIYFLYSKNKIFVFFNKIINFIHFQQKSLYFRIKDIQYLKCLVFIYICVQ